MNNPSMLLIECVDLCKNYMIGSMKIQALNHIHLEINYGAYIAILGPSGSGKSTLMNMLGCLDTPTSGTYTLAGNEVSHLQKNELAFIRNKKIGFVFQSFNLLEYASALENVALPLVYRGTKLKERVIRSEEALNKVGLSDRAHHKPNQLSGGQRQRVAIARALINEPDIILADEPTGNLDSQSGNEIIQLFENLVTENKTVIIVTHDITLAKRTQRILKMADGCLVK